MTASLRRSAIVALFAAALGAAIWVMLGDNSRNPRPSSGAPALRRTTLVRDYQNGRLTLEVTLHNPTPRPQLLAPPFVRLVDGNDTEIPGFFLAFDKPPTLKPGESETHELSFWLEKEHLDGELWLVANDTKALVKDAEPFDLNSMENQRSREFAGTHWPALP